MSTDEVQNQLGKVDTVTGTLAEDSVGVDANGNDISLKAGEEVVVNKSDIVDAGVTVGGQAGLPVTAATPETVHADAKKLVVDAEALGLDIFNIVGAVLHAAKEKI